MRDLRAAFKEHLEDPKLYGEAAARQQAFNEAYSQYKQLISRGGTFNKFFMEKVGTDYEIADTKITNFLNKQRRGKRRQPYGGAAGLRTSVQGRDNAARAECQEHRQRL